MYRIKNVMRSYTRDEIESTSVCADRSDLCALTRHGLTARAHIYSLHMSARAERVGESRDLSALSLIIFRPKIVLTPKYFQTRFCVFFHLSQSGE